MIENMVYVIVSMFGYHQKYNIYVDKLKKCGYQRKNR